MNSHRTVRRRAGNRRGFDGPDENGITKRREERDPGSQAFNHEWDKLKDK